MRNGVGETGAAYYGVDLAERGALWMTENFKTAVGYAEREDSRACETSQDRQPSSRRTISRAKCLPDEDRRCIANVGSSAPTSRSSAVLSQKSSDLRQP